MSVPLTGEQVRLPEENQNSAGAAAEQILSMSSPERYTVTSLPCFV